jgi:hypothetical protein
MTFWGVILLGGKEAVSHSLPCHHSQSESERESLLPAKKRERERKKWGNFLIHDFLVFPLFPALGPPVISANLDSSFRGP